MADQKQWFKLWCSAPGDEDIQGLPPADRWAWAALGAYTKRHGSHGSVVVSENNAVLRAEMGLDSEIRIFDVCLRLPNIRVVENSHGRFTVTWNNWTKYQEDSTQAERQKASRQRRRDIIHKGSASIKNVTVSEEKRREEKVLKAQNAVADQPKAVGSHRSDNSGKALKDVLTDAQSLRAKLLCRDLEALPRKVRPFLPWVFLQKSVTQGLPADDALTVLVGMRDRWSEIRDPWPYAAEVLRREYQQYRIDLQLEAHEKRKREPARVGAILAAAVARAQGQVSAPPQLPIVETPPDPQEIVERDGEWVPVDEQGEAEEVPF